MNSPLASKVLNPPSTQAVVAPQFSIRDIDEAVVNYFKRTFVDPRLHTIPLVSLTTAERWKLDRTLFEKDESGALVLPAISLNRGDIAYSENNMPGDAERLYVATAVEKEMSAQVRDFNIDQASKSVIGADNSAISVDSKDAANTYLVKRYVSTVFPKYVIIPYEFSFWCNTVAEANIMQELLLRSANWKKSFAMEGTKGQTYSAEFEGTFSRGRSNFNEQGEDRRIVEITGNITVNGYLTTQPQITTKMYPVTATPSFSRVRWQTETE